MQWDAHGNIMPRRPPMTNTERQQLFRQRNPGYYARLQAKRRAPLKLARKMWALQIVRVAEILNAYQKMPLMLPAPVEPIEIPGVTTIPLRDATLAPAMVEIRRAA
jgi:hypothetical protein